MLKVQSHSRISGCHYSILTHIERSTIKSNKFDAGKSLLNNKFTSLINSKRHLYMSSYSVIRFKNML